jgi:hypothetical protein
MKRRFQLLRWLRLPLSRLVLRWVFVGWWAVPCLAVFALICVVLDAGGWWDGEKWNYDPDLSRGFDWAADKIASFFKQNTQEVAGEALPPSVC